MEPVSCWLTTPEHVARNRETDIHSYTIEENQFSSSNKYQLQISSCLGKNFVSTSLSQCWVFVFLHKFFMFHAEVFQSFHIAPLWPLLKAFYELPCLSFEVGAQVIPKLLALWTLSLSTQLSPASPLSPFTNLHESSPCTVLCMPLTLSYIRQLPSFSSSS